ncbi:hypothetical protein JOB18_038158 [Solea senegalensis]|uniref:Uncharacterized protein n=1 Tax=Solea senegalensis TaxID=28829 RepID=A0AAV6SNN6_SOLSE|nr:hypothetical protein JOB18_038158 [Solea senegalensis]
MTTVSNENKSWANSSSVAAAKPDNTPCLALAEDTPHFADPRYYLAGPPSPAMPTYMTASVSNENKSWANSSSVIDDKTLTSYVVRHASQATATRNVLQNSFKVW